MHTNLVPKLWLAFMAVPLGLIGSEVAQLVFAEGKVAVAGVVWWLVALPSFGLAYYRFLLGDYVWLTTSAEVFRRYDMWIRVKDKGVFDFFGLSLQALIFCVLAVAIREPTNFLYAYVALMLVNVIWLAIQLIYAQKILIHLMIEQQPTNAKKIADLIRTIAFWIVNNALFALVGVIGFWALGEVPGWLTACLLLTLVNSLVDVARERSVYRAALSNMFS